MFQMRSGYSCIVLNIILERKPLFHWHLRYSTFDCKFIELRKFLRRWLYQKLIKMQTCLSVTLSTFTPVVKCAKQQVAMHHTITVMGSLVHRITYVGILISSIVVLL